MNRLEDDTLYIVMPAYNEGENIRETVDSWMRVLDGKSNKSRLVIADSGSTDDTHNKLLGLKKKYSKLEILEKTNQYHGPKVIALYNYAIKKNADYIFQTDSDGQTDPKEFEGFWEKREKHDAIIGYRNKRGDGRIRALVEKVVCILLRIFFSVKVPDANAPFRLMKTSLVEKYINRLPDEYDLPNIMLTAYFARFNENIAFETISFKPRTAGTNSVNIKKIFKVGKESLSAFRLFQKDMKNSDPENARVIKRRKLGTIAIAISFVAAALLAISTSPSSPWNRSEPVTDSGVFLTVGTQMKNGLIPYLDTFDHKGPVLYIINYLGVLIDPVSGILLFEFIALLVAIIYMYKIAKLVVDKRVIAWAVAMLVFSLYFTFNIIDRGNLTEEYAFPFVAMALYEFLKYLLYGKTSLLRVFMVGIGFACVLMLRINMVGIWGIFGLAILVKLLKSKQYKELSRIMSAFLGGVATILVPILVWLTLNGAFQAFIDVYIKFNASYTKGGGIGKTFVTIEYFFEQIILFMGWFLAGLFAILEKEKNKKFVLWSFFIAFSVAIVAACVSGRQYPHYGMVLIPLPVFSFSLLYKKMIDCGKGENGVILVTMFLVCFSYQPWLKVTETALHSFSHRSTGDAISSTITKSCEYINEYTNQEDKIAVYGNLGYIYLKCDRLPASRYSYQHPIAGIRPSIIDEFFDDVEKNQPKVFIVQGGYVDERVTGFLDTHAYTKVWHDAIIDEKTSTEIENTSRIYVLNDVLGK